MMHTETNMGTEKAVPWLHKQWTECHRLIQDGIPVIGFTWYSLIDQVDWDTALREDNGNVNDFGMYGIDRKIRPVGEAYQQIIKQYAHEAATTRAMCGKIVRSPKEVQTHTILKNEVRFMLYFLAGS